MTLEPGDIVSTGTPAGWERSPAAGLAQGWGTRSWSARRRSASSGRRLPDARRADHLARMDQGGPRRPDRGALGLGAYVLASDSRSTSPTFPRSISTSWIPAARPRTSPRRRSRTRRLEPSKSRLTRTRSRPPLRGGAREGPRRSRPREAVDARERERHPDTVLGSPWRRNRGVIRFGRTAATSPRRTRPSPSPAPRPSPTSLPPGRGRSGRRRPHARRGRQAERRPALPSGRA